MHVTEQETGITVRWAVTDHDPPAIHKMLVPSGHADVWVEARWQPPAVIAIEAGATPTGVPARNCSHLSLHNLTPETPTSTHYFYFFTRDFRVYDAALTEFIKDATESAFSDEDRPMIIAQQSRLGTADIMALKPVLLSVDAAAVLARRKLQKLMAYGQRAL